MPSELEGSFGITVPAPDVLPALRRDLLRPLDATLSVPRARARHAPRIFDPREPPMAGSVGPDHPAVQELRRLSLWSEGQVWCSPEMHRAVTGVFKNQIDWLPLELGATRPTQGGVLAVMRVSGGSQSFNAVNTLRLLGRWMRMFTIPNQSSVPKAYEQFDDAGRMRPGPLYDRVVDVMEELVRFTWLLRDNADDLVNRYSERASALKLPYKL